MVNPDMLRYRGTVNDDERHLLLRLARYAHARNRAIDREVRTIEITDDEAVCLLAVIGRLYAPEVGAS